MKVFSTNQVSVYQGNSVDELQYLHDKSIDCVVTSPPYYGLRTYDTKPYIWGGDNECNHVWENNFCECGAWKGHLGLEPSVDFYIKNLVGIFRKVRRVLKSRGTVWLNIGDTFKNKNLLLVPHRAAIALQDDGWYIRNDVVWEKPNAMPESVKDRCSRSHEYIFQLSKSANYYFSTESIKEPAVRPGDIQIFGGKKGVNYQPEPSDPNYRHGAEQWGRTITCGEFKNKRSVWSIATKPFPDSHFAVFPPEIPKICIQAGCPEGGTVLDIFAGSGTTLEVAKNLGRKAIGIEANPEYIKFIEQRCRQLTLWGLE